MTEKLKPCPFCGSNDIRAVPMPLVNDDPEDRRWWVGCANALDHDADTFADTKKKAIAAWNTRDIGWRPIEEAPKDGTLVWATGKSWGASADRHYAAVQWDGRAWKDDEDNFYSYLTHFQEITPPSSEAPHD